MKLGVDLGISTAGTIKVIFITALATLGIALAFAAIGLVFPLFVYALIALWVGVMGVSQQHKLEARSALIKMGKHYK